MKHLSERKQTNNFKLGQAGKNISGHYAPVSQNNHAVVSQNNHAV